jgi:Zn-dependent protease
VRSRTTLRVGRLAGIPIGVQPLWLVVVGLITYVLGHDWFPSQDPGLGDGAAYALGLLSALLLFAGIVLHELGHAVVARRRGVEVDEIDLWLLGGVSRLHGEPRRAGDELRFALAGPAVTAALLALAAVLRLALGGVLPAWARALLDYQVQVSSLILGFNLLPAFPLDGGRVARALLWLRSGDHDAATARASGIGRLFGMAMVAFGAFAFLGGAPGGLWFALIGVFLIVAATAEARQTELERSFAGTTVAELMSAPAVTLPAALTLEEAVREGFAHHLYSAFGVVDDRGRAIGVLTIQHVRAVPAARRHRVLAGEAAARDADLLVAPSLPVAELLGRPAFARIGRAVAVDPAGRPLGVVSATDVERRLRADALTAPEPIRVNHGSGRAPDPDARAPAPT